MPLLPTRQAHSPPRTSATTRLAWPGRGRGGATRGRGALRGWTHASGTRHTAQPAEAGVLVDARTHGLPTGKPSDHTLEVLLWALAWQVQRTHPHPTPGWRPGWVEGGRSARRRCLGGRTRRGQRYGPTLPTLAVARADGQVRAALVSRGQAGTPSLLPEWDACTTAPPALPRARPLPCLLPIRTPSCQEARRRALGLGGGARRTLARAGERLAPLCVPPWKGVGARSAPFREAWYQAPKRDFFRSPARTPARTPKKGGGRGGGGGARAHRVW